MAKTTHTVDCIIFGGGIAGLWLLDRCVSQNINAILLEAHSVGGTQSIASQGIIHGGLKYALSGTLSAEADAIADMPDRWRQCLAGQGEVDLRDVPVISDTQYLWSASLLSGGISSFFASKMLRGRIKKLSREELPEALSNKKFKGRAYAMNDLVLDVPFLLQMLARKHEKRIFLASVDDYQITHSENTITLDFAEQHITARTAIFSAGAGNQTLCAKASIDEPMQLRPLRMVTLETSSPIEFYGHCIGNGAKPRITITTHKKTNGNRVWYLGGEVAEHPNETHEATLQRAQKEVHELSLPINSAVLKKWFSDAELYNPEEEFDDLWNKYLFTNIRF